jgi:hypothetical protein
MRKKTCVWGDGDQSEFLGQLCYTAIMPRRRSDYSARAELVLKRSKWAIWYGTDGGAVAAAPAGNAAMGVLREASEASGEEAEAEEGGERQCEGAFHDRSP